MLKTKFECEAFSKQQQRNNFITFRASPRRREMYSGHGRLCVCVSVCVTDPRRMPTLLHGPGCNLGEL